MSVTEMNEVNISVKKRGRPGRQITYKNYKLILEYCARQNLKLTSVELRLLQLYVKQKHSAISLLEEPGIIEKNIVSTRGYISS